MTRYALVGRYVELTPRRREQMCTFLQWFWASLFLSDFRRIAGPLVAQFPLSNRLNFGR